MTINGELNTATREIVECDRCGKRCHGGVTVQLQPFDKVERPIDPTSTFDLCSECQAGFLSWRMEIENRQTSRYSL